jgi:hypothetical protein
MRTITLRRLRRELAARLDDLEARATAVERTAQRLNPGSSQSPPHPSYLHRALIAGTRIAWRANFKLRRSTAYLDQAARNPRISTAIRVSHGRLHDAAVCLTVACERAARTGTRQKVLRSLSRCLRKLDEVSGLLPAAGREKPKGFGGHSYPASAEALFDGTD